MTRPCAKTLRRTRAPCVTFRRHGERRRLSVVPEGAVASEHDVAVDDELHRGDADSMDDGRRGPSRSSCPSRSRSQTLALPCLHDATPCEISPIRIPHSRPHPSRWAPPPSPSGSSSRRRAANGGRGRRSDRSPTARTGRSSRTSERRSCTAPTSLYGIGHMARRSCSGLAVTQRRRPASRHQGCARRDRGAPPAPAPPCGRPKEGPLHELASSRTARPCGTVPPPAGRRRR